MHLQAQYPTTNFFTGDFEMKPITFYLTDGGCDSGNICHIKDIGVTVDYDNLKAEILVIEPIVPARKFIYAEINISTRTGLDKLSEFFDDVNEWFGFRNTWRKIDATGKKLTICRIKDGVCKTETIQPKPF